MNNVYYLLVLPEAIGPFLVMELPHVWSAVVVVATVVVVLAVVVVEVVVSTKMNRCRILKLIKTQFSTLLPFCKSQGAV